MTEEGTNRSVHRFTEKELSGLTRIDNIIQPYESVNRKKCMPEFLWWLCRLGKDALCTQLLEKNLKKTFNHGRMAGKTCIHMAVYWYHIHLIPLLCKHKFEIDCGDDRWLSPLFWAVFSDNTSSEKSAECADRLRRYGADKEDTTPFQKTNKYVCELINDRNKARLKLFSNSGNEIRDALRLFKEENDRTKRLGLDIDFWINFWLWKFSATQDQVPLCIYLIEEGARPTEVFYITSAFHRAARFGNTELLRYLLDPNMKKRWPEVVHSVDKLGWTALHNASLNNQEHCVLLLLQHGADWGKTTREGTALDIAKKYHSQRAVKLLEDQYQRDDDDDDDDDAERKADWRIETREGSALDIAEEHNSRSVVKLFENAQIQAHEGRVRHHATDTSVSVDIESVETVIIAKKVIVHSPQDGTTNVLSAGDPKPEISILGKWCNSVMLGIRKVRVFANFT